MEGKGVAALGGERQGQTASLQGRYYSYLQLAKPTVLVKSLTDAAACSAVPFRFYFVPPKFCPCLGFGPCAAAQAARRLNVQAAPSARGSVATKRSQPRGWQR